MMRDVLVASICRGQFPLALIGVIVLAIVLKMPSEDVTRVLFHLVDLMERHEVLGYVLAAMCATGWFLHARLQRRWIGDERRRLNNERTELLAALSGTRDRSNEVHP